MAKLQPGQSGRRSCGAYRRSVAALRNEAVAGEMARRTQIDVLINNAGALFNSAQETADGLEKTFALNHMSYFVSPICCCPG